MHQYPPNPLDLAAQIASDRPLPPVDRWNPPLCGDIDIRIARNGTWYHEGQPIQRDRLVRLFASILRRDEDGAHYLVTPVEKWRIRVDDAPFLAVRLDSSGTGCDQSLRFTTNVGDIVTADSDHPLTVEYRTPDGQPSPYLRVRGRLRALLSRAVFLEMAELGEERPSATGRDYGVWSQGLFFRLGQLDDER